MVKFDVMVPAKMLTKSKTRLSSVLSQEQKDKLVIGMLRDVLNALCDSPHVNRLVVVTSDKTLIQIAQGYKALIIRDPETGDLNSALDFATQELLRDDQTYPLLIIPSDVPLIDRKAIEGFARRSKESNGRFVIAITSRSNGTNAMLRAPPNAIPTQFGPSSFDRHKEAAHAKGICFIQYNCAEIVLDLDTVDDMKEILVRGPHTYTSKIIQEFIDSGTIL